MSGDRLSAPDQYAESLKGAPVLSSAQAGWRSGLVSRWTGVSGEIRQPPIDPHHVVLHLGGPKRVTHAGDGRTISIAVEEGALTLAPAGTRYAWKTVGPINFAHLYVHPSRLSSLIASKFDRDPSSVTLDERIGFEDPLLTYVVHRRLERAKRRLRAPDLPLAEVARRTGLGTPSRVAASFRRHVGQTPSRYRRQL